MRPKPKGCAGYWNTSGLNAYAPVRAIQFSDTARNIMCIVHANYGALRKGDRIVIPTVEFEPF